MQQWLSRELTLSARTLANLDRLRHGLAALALVWFVVVSVTASLTYGVLGITEECVAPVWLFVIAMWPEMVQELRSLLRSKVVLLTVIVLVICAASWLMRGYSIHEPRLRFMLGVALLFPAAVGWFRRVGHRGMQFAFVVKACVLAYACYKFGVAFFQGMPTREMFVRPPIYRHLRHFNYDLTLVAGMAGGVFGRVDILSRLFWFVVFVVLGFFSFWTGGRGEFLALAVVLTVLVMTRRSTDDPRVFVFYVAGFLLGGVLLMLSGETQYLFGQIERSTRGGLNAVSSGRLGIWMGTLAKGMSSTEGALLGHGPESFVRWGVFAQFRHYIAHPHNTLVQWIFEYGLLGAAALCASAFWLASRCVLPAVKEGTGMQRLCAATLIGMSAFALVDGIYYHAAPLLFITLMWAYLYAAWADSGRTAGDALSQRLTPPQNSRSCPRASPAGAQR